MYLLTNYLSKLDINIPTLNTRDTYSLTIHLSPIYNFSLVSSSLLHLYFLRSLMFVITYNHSLIQI